MSLYKSLVSLFLFWVAGSCYAFDVDIDSDGVVDSVDVAYADEIAEIKIQLSTLGDVAQQYSIEPFDDCSHVVVDFEKYPGTLILDGSCAGRGGQIYIDIYVWNQDLTAWILSKSVSGERGVVGKSGLPSLEVDRVECCVKLGARGDGRKYLSDNQQNIVVRKEISDLVGRISNLDGKQRVLSELDYYTLLEYASYMSIENVQQLNDLGYYLWKEGLNDRAYLLLSTVVEEFPNRTVAHLNMADVLWDMSDKDRALTYYRNYHHRMLSAKKQSRIPDRVFTRMQPGAIQPPTTPSPH